MEPSGPCRLIDVSKLISVGLPVLIDRGLFRGGAGTHVEGEVEVGQGRRGDVK